MTSEQLTAADRLAIRLAHHALAAAVKAELPLDHEVTARTWDERAGIQAVVILGPWIPAQPATLEEIRRDLRPPLPMPLRDVEQCALEAAPLPGERPVSVAQLARRAGYADSGHFREAVRVLVDRGLLVRARGGIRRA